MGLAGTGLRPEGRAVEEGTGESLRQDVKEQARTGRGRVGLCWSRLSLSLIASISLAHRFGALVNWGKYLVGKKMGSQWVQIRAAGS